MATVIQEQALGAPVSSVEEFEVRQPSFWAVRTWLAMAVWLVITDLAIYRGGGWSGMALVFAIVPGIVAFGPRYRWAAGLHWRVASVLLLLLSVKLVWCGSIEAGLAAAATSLAVVVSGQGMIPFVGRTILVPFRMLVGTAQVGIESIVKAIGVSEAISNQKLASSKRWQPSVAIGIPIGVVLLFASTFVLANPNFRVFFDEQMRWLESVIESWVASVDVAELVFWCFSGAFCCSILFPYVADLLRPTVLPATTTGQGTQERAAYFYPAARNTLVALTILFAIYLVYEFYSMWFQEFPAGFYHAGYAHEGAFWLTVALAMAVFTLSAVFSKTMLVHQRIGLLKKLAWIWSAENFLLVAAVYNRLFIYIDFNGMTRMRVVGLLGVAAVVVGFCWVIVKILMARDIVWLIQRQLWAPALALITYAILPVDWLVHAYNANHVLAGDLAPSVQMIVHPTRADGMLQIVRLIDCENIEIREGVRAMAAKWADELQQRVGRSRTRTGGRTQPRAASTSDQNWTDYQIAEQLLKEVLSANASKLTEYSNATTRSERLQRFYGFAYRWY